FHVTGVQTCALPISRYPCHPAQIDNRRSPSRQRRDAAPGRLSRSSWRIPYEKHVCVQWMSMTIAGETEPGALLRRRASNVAYARSEERRVGYECEDH